jgi:hypothetical protein
MTHSVPLSFTPASNAGHQTIGKNGSFWLPPDLQASSFDSHLKNQMKPNSDKGGTDSSLVSHKKVLNSTTNISKGIEGRVAKKNTQVNLKAFKQIHRVASESKKITAESNDMRTGIRKSNPSVSKMVLRNHNVLSHPLTNQTTSSYLTPVNSYNNTPNTSNPLISTKYSPQTALNLKLLEDNSVRVGARDGIKDATVSLNAECLNRSKSSLSNDSKWSNSDANDNSKFLFETALRKILPLFSRTSSERSEIVRFATELPNGESVAMRIECNSKEISLVSICSNVAIHEDIASSSHDLLESLASLTNRKTSFQIFSSYEAFDQYHTN